MCGVDGRFVYKMVFELTWVQMSLDKHDFLKAIWWFNVNFEFLLWDCAREKKKVSTWFIKNEFMLPSRPDLKQRSRTSATFKIHKVSTSLHRRSLKTYNSTVTYACILQPHYMPVCPLVLHRVFYNIRKCSWKTAFMQLCWWIKALRTFFFFSLTDEFFLFSMWQGQFGDFRTQKGELCSLTSRLMHHNKVFLYHRYIRLHQHTGTK